MKKNDRPEEFSKDVSQEEIEEIFVKLKNLDIKKKTKFKFFCPLCASERRIPYTPNPSFKTYVQVGIFGLVLLVIFFPVFDWKGLVLFFPLYGFFELIYRFKKRQDSVCPYCGFDFFLYKADIEKAKEKVREFWAKKKALKEKKEENLKETLDVQKNKTVA